MNSVANGKILANTSFKKIFIPFAPGDNGGAIGAALYASSKILNKKKFIDNCLINSSPYLGKKYKNNEISFVLENNKNIKEIANIYYYNDDLLIKKTAQCIAQKKIVGWFQDRIEFGSRALGNRSVLADPRDDKIRDKINAQIKIREMFRPFAPSILEEYVDEYFEQSLDSSYMSFVFKVKNNKIKKIPAVTHVDGTGRLQTITSRGNFKFYSLISQFHKITGIPLLLNTSLNENEPIVMSPEDALNMFIRTKLDIMVMQNFFLIRK
jgi:carbamoyltransferase